MSKVNRQNVWSMNRLLTWMDEVLCRFEAVTASRMDGIVQNRNCASFTLAHFKCFLL